MLVQADQTLAGLKALFHRPLIPATRTRVASGTGRGACGKGAKGHRLYGWAFVRLDRDDSAPGDQAGQHWLLVRRNHYRY